MLRMTLVSKNNAEPPMAAREVDISSRRNVSTATCPPTVKSNKSRFGRETSGFNKSRFDR
jgi:hypothetical protein